MDLRTGAPVEPPEPDRHGAEGKGRSSGDGRVGALEGHMADRREPGRIGENHGGVAHQGGPGAPQSHRPHRGRETLERRRLPHREGGGEQPEECQRRSAAIHVAGTDAAGAAAGAPVGANSPTAPNARLKRIGPTTSWIPIMVMMRAESETPHSGNDRRATIANPSAMPAWDTTPIHPQRANGGSTDGERPAQRNPIRRLSIRRPTRSTTHGNISLSASRRTDAPASAKKTVYTGRDPRRSSARSRSPSTGEKFSR